MSGAEVVYLDRVESAFPLRMELRPGTRVPAHCSASGKLFLAWMPSRQRHAVLDGLALTRSHRPHLDRAQGIGSRTRNDPPRRPRGRRGRICRRSGVCRRASVRAGTAQGAMRAGFAGTGCAHDAGTGASAIASPASSGAGPGAHARLIRFSEFSKACRAGAQATRGRRQPHRCRRWSTPPASRPPWAQEPARRRPTASRASWPARTEKTPSPR